MIKKQISHLSDQTLFLMLSSHSKDLKNIRPEVDENAFGFFVQSEQNSLLRKRRKRISASICLYLSLGITLFLLSEMTMIPIEKFGVVLVIYSVIFLFARELFNSKNKKQNSYEDYQKAFLSMIEKENTVRQSQHEDVFEALIMRMSMILSLDLQNKEVRLKEIISEINKAEDKFNKIFVIPVRLKGILGHLSEVFKGHQDEEVDAFIHRHSVIGQKVASQTLVKTQTRVEELVN
jgi:hypothetical protein